MLRKKPVLILLVLSALLWIAAALQHAQLHRFSAKAAASLIVAHLEQSERSTKRFIAHHPDVMQRAVSGTQTPADADALAALPASIFIYNNDRLVSWNSAGTEPVMPKDVKPAQPVLRQDDALYLVRRIQPVAGNNIAEGIILYPILEGYPFENDYLISHYAGAERIPPTAKLTDTVTAGAEAVILHDGTQIGYITLTTEEAGHHKPDMLITLLVIFAVIALLGAVQAMAIQLLKRGKTGYATLFTIGAAILFRGLIYKTGLPFELSEWPLFSPQLYASSALHPSLGDLLLNAVALLWIAVFLSTRLAWQHINTGRKWRGLKAFGVALIMCVLGYGATRITGTVVVNSSIGFDITHLYAFDADTISGLLTVSILAGAIALILYFLQRLLKKLIPARLLRYACMVAACAAVYATGWPSHEPQLYILFCVWVLLIIMLGDVKKLSLSNSFFAPPILFWMVFFCAYTTILLQHYVGLHELDTRKSFAERILQRRDDAMEWSFNNLAARIAQDTVLSSYLSKPTPASRAAFNERLSALYLNNELNNYSAEVLLFNDASPNQPVFNDDTLSYSILQERENGGQPASAKDLYYFEDAQDDHDYLAHILLRDSTCSNGAHLFIDLSHKKAASETVLPELLQPSLINKAQRESDYKYAVYNGGRLAGQSPDYPFPYYIKRANGANIAEYEWRQNSDISMLLYRPGNAREAVVVRVRDSFKAALTLFSYLFGLQLIIGLLIAICRYIANRLGRRKDVLRPFTSFTLSQRIQLSMLGVVLASFLIIAVTTIAFFRQRYEESNRRSIQATLQTAVRSISQHLSEQSLTGSGIQATMASFDFRKFIASLAQQQKTDVNIYDTSGTLVTTSQEDIYNQGILNRLMRPQALATLRNNHQPLLLRIEQIGKLSYNSSYVPLEAPGGLVIGYLNIPFFSSQKEIDAQVSNILVALINLYAFIFLLSSLLAVLTTRWLTRTLAIIIQQFNRLGLAGNELLDWPYEDEIGVLVGEYNKMVRKVEESATLLAQSEREGAWREMARQVAHEIKNPLTPMKLNIQYLQSALRNDHPDLRALTKRVADSMLEQIDNLSYIASEFSNFATLPEARAEEIVLNELLEKVAALYYNEPDIDVTLSVPETAVMIYADRSQLNRIITNLLQNAVQAIPTDERRGAIKISLRTGPESRAVIAVRDNGKGIEPDIAERLFRPYFTTKSSGTGLGLAMTRKMVELWKGKIWYETEVGVYTTFFIELPIEGGNEQQATS